MKTKLLKIFFKIIWRLAHKYVSKRPVTVVGVTWSVGKTSARMAIYASLKKLLKDKNVYTPFKNYNWELGLSLAVLELEDYTPTIAGAFKTLIKAVFKALVDKPWYDIVVLEYGIDHIGEMDFMLSVVKPDFGVLTLIDKVHAQYLSDPDIIADEKYKMIFASQQAVFLNWEDSYAHSANVEVNRFWFLTRPKEIVDQDLIKKVDICFEGYKLQSDFKASAKVCIKNQQVKVLTDVIAPEIFAYIGIGLAIGDILHYRDTKHSLLNSTLKELELSIPLLGGRSTILKGINQSIVIDSTYNAAPASMKKMIQLGNFLKTNFMPDKKVLLLLGDMRELGDFEESEHRQLAWVISQVADAVVLVGPKMKQYLIDELQKIDFVGREGEYPVVKRFCSAPKAGEWIKQFLTNSKDKWLILAKGSQNTIFLEEALKYFIQPQEQKKLVRQDQHWLEVKQNYFKKLGDC